MDITNYDNVIEIVRFFQPRLIIHSAALVGFRETEKEPRLTRQVNVLGTQNLVLACKKFGTKFVFISSAAVFDGKKGYYTEHDTPNPQYLYAQTKLDAETIVSDLDDHLIIRTDFFDPLKSKYDNVYIDHFCSKEPTTVIARKIFRAIELDLSGIIHIGGPRRSLYDLLKPIFPNISPIRIIDSSRPDFPRDLSLSSEMFRRYSEMTF
jgi:dTDP-4-dehydrorhamnose reductase